MLKENALEDVENSIRRIIQDAYAIRVLLYCHGEKYDKCAV